MSSDVPRKQRREPAARWTAETADEAAPNWALAPGSAATSPELRAPAPEAGVAPDEGGIHWHEQPEVGLAEGHPRAEGAAPESPEVT